MYKTCVPAIDIMALDTADLNPRLEEFTDNPNSISKQVFICKWKQTPKNI